MGPYLADRVKDTSTTTGTGTLTLANSAPTGFRTFGSGIGDGNQCYYTIAHQSATEWETGIGTYTASGTTLSRTQVLSSSNSGSAVNFSSGTKDVFISPLATQLAHLPDITPPVDGDFSWINQTADGKTASVTARGGGISLMCEQAGTDTLNLRIREKIIPTAPYTVTTLVRHLLTPGSGNKAGLILRDDTQTKVVSFLVAWNGWATLSYLVDSWSNYSTINTNYYDSGAMGAGGSPGTVWLRIKDDNTNRSFWLSHNGTDFTQLLSQGRTTYITPTRIGFCVDARRVSYSGVDLLSWKQE